MTKKIGYEKISALNLTVIVLIAITACGSKLAEVAIDYVASNLYTNEDMDNAITLIKSEFAIWDGYKLHSISYAGDDCNTDENIKWMNDLGEGKNYTQCIEFLSDFHSPKNGGGSWEADEEYKDWAIVACPLGRRRVGTPDLGVLIKQI